MKPGNFRLKPKTLCLWITFTCTHGGFIPAWTGNHVIWVLVMSLLPWDCCTSRVLKENETQVVLGFMIFKFNEFCFDYPGYVHNPKGINNTKGKIGKPAQCVLKFCQPTREEGRVRTRWILSKLEISNNQASSGSYWTWWIWSAIRFIYSSLVLQSRNVHGHTCSTSVVWLRD